MTRPALVLASGSSYRRELLGRLRIPFDIASPDVDESPLPGELPDVLARRLAHTKAETIQARNLEAVVIGSDQVPSLDGEILHKPGNHERAREQLQRCSGQRLSFHTGLCVLSPGRPPQLDCIPFAVYFRELEDREIERYLALDEPYDCAGSFKWESLGISLFERLEGEDPTALQGLPLIALCRMLRAAGLDPLA